ncbi:MFS transporter [Alcaligenes pakistanensis]|uniref:Bcr/CflA family efflux transporter n=1 Tax=Alcaligenes pakistanensis TaxID=1482717 RepID=A0A8H9IH39_9BURK|nr:multidrug effflux MFS transporter [Alcaligenes pakistanensis]GHC40428.1 MFS transporter [Alcaligenes pakistanensis]
MVLILGLLACVAPATIDAYLPAFSALEREFNVPPESVQQTLGVYMSAYAAMLLLHGTLSDAWGRKPVILASLLVYIAGSVMAALAPELNWLMAGRVLQGASAGAGLVIGQAIVRDCYQGDLARRTLSYIVVVFNVSPALAPIVGGQLIAHWGWRPVFWMLASLAALACWLCLQHLPETLASAKRQPLAWPQLRTELGLLLRDLPFMGMSLALSLLVGAQAFLIGAAPDFISHTLKLPETAFAVLFVPLVIGAMLGALASAHLAKRWSDTRIICCAYGLMLGSCVAYTLYLTSSSLPTLPWAVLLPAFFTTGLAMLMPVVTLRILVQVPSRAGLAASLLGFCQMATFSLVSGWLVPWVYGQPLRMSAAMLVSVLLSLLSWLWLQQGADRRRA